METPTNPLLRLVDLTRLVEMIRAEKGQRCLICCDNTFATAWNQQPLSFGADLAARLTVADTLSSMPVSGDFPPKTRRTPHVLFEKP